jgi:hypothetical protein
MSGSRKMRLVSQMDIPFLQNAKNKLQVFSEYQVLEVNRSPAVDTNMNNGWRIKAK